MMVDIAMCSIPCRRSATCYRAQAEPSPDQWWLRPVDSETCDQYWEVKSKSEVRRLNLQLSE